MEENYGNKYDRIKKIQKQSIPHVMILFTMVNSTVKRLGFIKPSSWHYDGEKLCFIWILGRRESVHKETLITVKSAFFFENYFVITTGKDVLNVSNFFEINQIERWWKN